MSELEQKLIDRIRESEDPESVLCMAIATLEKLLIEEQLCGCA